MENVKRLLGLSIILLFTLSAFADVPMSVNYQGKLTDDDGVPYHDEVLDIQFRLYDAATAGNLMWTSGAESVNPQHGLFSTEIDFSGGVWEAGYSIKSLDDGTVYLEVLIGSPLTALSPREKITSTFHAFNIADDAVSEAKLLM
ncbi:MAG TPA: hypothetical protein ENN07_07190, partial [candidate division Zixibacteria bacterium]|nr:hypothetical protein [candidate division Zixibacteria bacterium]